jgi:hypothetical protein
MNSADAIHRAALVIASESWWKPIIGYLVTNCAKFSGIDFSNDEHDCFLRFRKLFTELFDCFVCKKIGIKSSALEAAFLEGVNTNNRQAMAILEMLRQYSDFLFFREQMIAMGIKVQEETASRLIALHAQMTATNTEEATNVAAILEEGEDAILERETNQACADMIEKLQLRHAEVMQFVGGAKSGLTPRRSSDLKSPPHGQIAKQASTGALKGARSTILKPLAVKK